jgi:carboxypeptidase Q
MVDGNKTSRELDVLALGNSLGSGTVTAEVLAVQDFAELERRKDEVKGKIVYYNNGFNPTNIKPFISYGEAGIYRRSGPSRAAKYGAVGVMIRSLSESTPMIRIRVRWHTTIHFLRSRPLPLDREMPMRYGHSRRKSKISMAMYTNGHFLPDTIGHNVIAELKGTEFPDQYITIGGHLDSWDVNEGAHDDGTGVVHTIEIMRALQAIGYKPKHTSAFCFICE